MNRAGEILFVPQTPLPPCSLVQVDGSTLITPVGSLVLQLWLVYLVGSRRLEKGRRERPGYLLLRLPLCRPPVSST